MRKYIIAVLVVLLVTSCVSNVKFHPDELPNGRVGEKYYTPVNITGGSGPVVDFNYQIHPGNSGLKLTFETKKYHTDYLYNKFTIEGEPHSAGEFYIKMKGGLVGGAGQVFEKTYKVKINY
jgi:hypothetical protein